MQEEKGWKATGCRKGSAREGKEWLNLQGLDVGRRGRVEENGQRMVAEFPACLVLPHQGKLVPVCSSGQSLVTKTPRECIFTQRHPRQNLPERYVSCQFCQL